MKFGDIGLQLKTHRLTESVWIFWDDVILSRWRPCGLPTSPSSASDVIGSLHVLQFLINSTFILVHSVIERGYRHLMMFIMCDNQGLQWVGNIWNSAFPLPYPSLFHASPMGRIGRGRICFVFAEKPFLLSAVRRCQLTWSNMAIYVLNLNFGGRVSLCFRDQPWWC